MPHAVFNVGDQAAASIDTAARHLIPGVEPGGSRAGQEIRPALLIRDAWLEPIEFDFGSAAAHFAVTWFLKLSQEIDLSPGLLLPVATLQTTIRQVDATGSFSVAPNLENLFHAQGSVWAPRVVGVKVLITSGAATMNNLDADVHLDYERVDVPWMDWFIMWEFLDNVVDDEKEY